MHTLGPTWVLDAERERKERERATTEAGGSKEHERESERVAAAKLLFDSSPSRSARGPRALLWVYRARLQVVSRVRRGGREGERKRERERVSFGCLLPS